MTIDGAVMLCTGSTASIKTNIISKEQWSNETFYICIYIHAHAYIYILLSCFTSCVQLYCVNRKLNLACVCWFFVIFCAVPSMMLHFQSMCVYI